jgi:hypothetical protein
MSSSSDFGGQGINVIHNERRVIRSVVMLQGPGVVLFVWTFAPDVLTLIASELRNGISIHHLSWWNKFLMHDVFRRRNFSTFCVVVRSNAVSNPLHHRLMSVGFWNLSTTRSLAFDLRYYHKTLV